MIASITVHIDEQDIFVSNALERDEHESRKHAIDRMVIMLSRLGRRGFSVDEEQPADGDDDKHFDFDLDKDAHRNQAH